MIRPDTLYAHPADVSLHLPIPDPKTSPVKRNRASRGEEDPESPIKTPRTIQRLSKDSPGKHTTLTPDLVRTRMSPRGNESMLTPRSLCLATEEEKAALIDKVAPTLLKMIETCKETLQGSLDKQLTIEERLKRLPKRADLESSSGSYICSDAARKPLVVVKPALQEQGGRYSPTEDAKDANGKKKQQPGINPGESVVRELLAWLTQKHLQLDFGVPPVCLTTMNHPLFGDLKMVGQHMRDLKKIDIHFSNDDLFKIIDTYAEPEMFVKAVLEPKLQVPLKALAAKNVPPEEIERLVTFCRSMKNAKTSDFKTALRVHFQGAPWLQDAIPKIDQLSGIIDKEAASAQALKDLYTAFKNNQGLEEVLVSVQQYEPKTSSLNGPEDEEYEPIPQEEFYKFILDIILFNTDRHLDNVLVQESGNSLRLILIDHGLCLPRPMIADNYAGVKKPTFEFLQFPEASCKIEGKIKETLLKLDVDSFIDTIKSDLGKHSELFPQLGKAFTEECFLLLEFNLRFIQRGLSVGATLREMATFQLPAKGKAESEMVTCLKKVIRTDAKGHFSLDLSLLDKELEQRFR